MSKLKLYKDWPGPRGIMHAGEYDIPRVISLAHAKCARADGAGEIITDAQEVAPPPSAAGGVAPASATFQPETKENPSERAPAGKTTGGRQPGKRGAGSPAS